MANPVPPLDSARDLDTATDLGVSQSAGPVPLPSSSHTLPAPSAEVPRGRIVPGERSARTNPKLNDTAERVGTAVGAAVERVRDLPRRLQDVKQRFTVIRGRKSEDAAAVASEWKETAQEKYRHVRTRADVLAHEYPLETIAGVAAFGFIVGFMLRIWRSHARD